MEYLVFHLNLAIHVILHNIIDVMHGAQNGRSCQTLLQASCNFAADGACSIAVPANACCMLYRTILVVVPYRSMTCGVCRYDMPVVH